MVLKVRKNKKSIHSPFFRAKILTEVDSGNFRVVSGGLKILLDKSKKLGQLLSEVKKII